MGKTFKENLKELLEYNDMTIKELAYQTGISHRSIENYLNSRESIPPADYACKIAKTLNTTVEDLLSENGINLDRSRYPRELLSIIKIFPNLNTADQKLISALVQSLSKKRILISLPSTPLDNTAWISFLLRGEVFFLQHTLSALRVPLKYSSF